MTLTPEMEKALTPEPLPLALETRVVLELCRSSLHRTGDDPRLLARLEALLEKLWAQA